MPESKIPPDLLAQHWVHSHEEDTATEMVFRPASHPFPRSRGRQAFELGVEGTLIESGPGPSDRPERSPGRWRLTEDGALALYRGSASTPYRVLHIVSLGKDRLVLRKAP
jgi:hypothetical protein